MTTEIQIWFNGLLIQVFSKSGDKWSSHPDIIKAYLTAWNGGIVILHNHEQVTLSPECTRLYRKRMLHRLKLDYLI